MNNPLQDFKYSKAIEIRWRDLDAMNHVNNSVYLSYLEHARTHYLHEAIQWDWQKESLILANVNIDFRVALLLTDTPLVHVRCTRLGNKSFTLQYAITTLRNGNTILAATAETALVVYDYATETTMPLTPDMRRRFEQFEGTTFEKKA